MAKNSKRRGQLVVPFGIGAMIDFKDDTLITAGMDFWPVEIGRNKHQVAEDCRISDERLERRLSNTQIGGVKKKIDCLYQPSQARNNSGHAIPQPHTAHMPFFRFPRLLFCPQQKCRAITKAKLSDEFAPRCRKCKSPGLKPIRFLVACEKGHIDDFPVKRWIDCSCSQETEDFRFLASPAPGLSGISFKCNTCGKKQNLNGTFKKNDKVNSVLPSNCCTGSKPWLGPQGDRDICTEPMRTIQRGASNTYFPNTLSSILIPPYSGAARQYVKKTWREIKEVMVQSKSAEIDGQSVFDDDRLKLLLGRDVTRSGIEIERLIKSAKERWYEEHGEPSAADIDEIPYRKREYEAYLSGRPEVADRRDFDTKSFEITEYEPVVSRFFSEIILVKNLRETRALTGFSRLQPVGVGQEDVQMFKKGSSFNWLPATEVRGEGIFLRFDYDAILEWKKKWGWVFVPHIINHKNWFEKMLKDGSPNFARAEEVSETLLMIHTFSHVFMRQLIFKSGYDSSSLRERLYVSELDETKMAGLLIYTAAGDSEGTLGGLVEQGRPGNFEKILFGAMESEICSNDPVCIETEQQGLVSLNGAACHSCALVPETSCEHNNTLLDRKYLFGDVENKAGFFSPLVDHLR